MLGDVLPRPSAAAPRTLRGGGAWVLATAVAYARSYGLAAAVLGACLFAFVQTRGYVASFVDESDNFLGGFLIAHGAVLYRDYFSHHMPLPYFLAAAASRLGASSIQDYRAITAVVLFTLSSFVFFRFQQRVGRALLAIALVTIAFSHAAFWGNMLLAETILSWAVLILFFYFVDRWPSLDFSIGDRVVISVATFAAATSTLVSAYPLLALVAVYVWRKTAGRGHSDRPAVGRELVFLGIMALPFVLASGWLALNGLLGAFFDQTITFNRVYYSRFDLASDPVSILIGALRGDYHLLRASFNPASFGGTDGFLILAGGAAGLVLARQRGVMLGALYWALLVLTRLRTEPFHNQAYGALSDAGVAIVVIWAVSSIRAKLAGEAENVSASFVRGVAVTLAPMLALVGALVFYVALGTLYAQLLGRLPAGGYSFQYTAAVEAMTQPGDRIWVGPVDPQAYLATGRLPASRYAFYLPWLGASPEISSGFLRDLQATRPPVIVMPIDAVLERFAGGRMQQFAIGKYAQPLAAYLARAYVPVDAGDPKWKSVFLRRDEAGALRQRLEDAGLYQRGSASSRAGG